MSMDLAELKFLHAFNTIPGVGGATIRRLRRRFGSYGAAWRAQTPSYEEAGLDVQALAALRKYKSSVDPDREMQKLSRPDVWVIADDDPAYPDLLKEISSPPAILYGRGDKMALSRAPACAVVGTRRPTPYGLEACAAIASGLAAAGVAVVSGLAAGIDTRAHTAALEQKAVTIAVLGSGVDPASVFPPQNRGLAERIASSGGVVVSEYAPGTPAVREHFPMRNRIIAGLARATVVAEAREKSGALITARMALEENRDVFAIPGSIFSPTADGAHALIRQGAMLARGARDILEELGLDAGDATRHHAAQSLEPAQARLLALLDEPRALDAIRRETDMNPAGIMAALAVLEMQGLVRHLGDDTYQKT